MKEFKNFDLEETLIIKFRKLFESYGYEKIKVNTFETYDTYFKNKDIINNEKVLKIIHPNGSLYALRADMTMIIAKKFANDFQTKDINISEKVYYYDNIFRNEFGINGGLKEKRQVGIENLGTNGIFNDVETIILALNSLETISDNYILEISNVELLKSIFKNINITEDDKNIVLKFIFTKNRDELLKFLDNLKIETNYKNIIDDITTCYGSINDILIKLSKYNELKDSLNYFNNLKLYIGERQLKKIKINFSISNSLEYYTGLILQGFVEDINNPIIIGGRYDNLSKRFGKAFPAIGFAIDLDSLIKKLDIKHHLADYLIFYTEESVKFLQDIDNLRKQGKTVKISPYKKLTNKTIEELHKKYKNICKYVGGELKSCI
ncbi:ATP phosphoribosyltransferase regulatory subunit [Hypnocyclicus thermotrophus]|uniref:ATP phosphoribosyltransferase regulatory subunit n=1 Tax=Hypnocyclicus thermotrophus TaxID=1627895 RepID=A0AA46I6B3_9FUSO|nr:ATP phosphoribosyltransferase regulatory subunit [Hypnocyclicus thermotrophus]TDT71457.1 ATP phosphoribosyltransferase regulatory subunit [Hypnocyclicus thermotrophus]